jgi:thiamine pyrophosphate-dependent acetolactate synthase large subunit-like protein
MATTTIAPKTTGSDKRKGPEWGSDVIVDLLKAYEIPYVSFNPGSTFRGLHDSIVNYGGNTMPEVILCNHEAIAVYVAHGYAKATGKPMVAIVHDTCGLLNAADAIFNAWCDRVPLIILGGTAPTDALERRPNTDWHHSALVHGNAIRDYVKWDDQPFKVSNFAESFMRAYKIAMTPPTGPVYICYDELLQEERITEPYQIPDVRRYAPPVEIGPNMDAIREAARWLVASREPVLTADMVYRHPTVAKDIVTLAELLAMAVVDRGIYSVNFPTQHPLYVSGNSEEILKGSDLILALDCHELYAEITSKDKFNVKPRRYLTEFLAPGAKVVQIALEGLLVGSWSNQAGRIQPIDLDILADTKLAIPALIAECRTLLANDPAAKQRIAARRERTASVHDGLRAGWVETTKKQHADKPIALSRLSTEIGALIENEDWVLVHDDLKKWNQRMWDWTGPERWLGHSGGGGLGYGPGGSIGAALALRGSGKLCIDINADGDFLYNGSALWTAAHDRIPLLFVVYNNRSYHNSEQHAMNMARDRGRDGERRFIGTQITDPAVDFGMMARAFGIHGEGPIEDPRDLRPALERALRVVKEEKRAALVDVVTQPR